MMVFGAGDRSPHLWLALGLALAKERAGEVLALEALRRAEVLGHLHARDVGVRLDREAYEMHAVEADADFAEGQAEVATMQAEEDARIRAGERAEVFGY
jgi:hypothetical protein